ncbi:hypothetical protein ACFOLD_10975 [Kocuria carniphila]|uniref:hypothetical protein n=1 Tax=Kocuria carniphila TaxID=262208 RepID=UPI003619AD01
MGGSAVGCVLIDTTTMPGALTDSRCFLVDVSTLFPLRSISIVHSGRHCDHDSSAHWPSVHPG